MFFCFIFLRFIILYTFNFGFLINWILQHFLYVLSKNFSKIYVQLYRCLPWTVSSSDVLLLLFLFQFLFLFLLLFLLLQLLFEKVFGERPVRPPCLLVSLVLCLVIAVCYVYPIVLQFVYSLNYLLSRCFIIIIISFHRICCCFCFVFLLLFMHFLPNQY